MTAGTVAGQFLAGFSTFVPKIKLKWQLVTSVCIFTAFIGGSAGVTSSTKTMAIVFSLISGIMIGYIETLTIGGGPLTQDAKDIGLAAGVQYTFRSGTSALAGKLSIFAFDDYLRFLHFANYLNKDSIFVTIVSEHSRPSPSQV